MRAHYIQHVPFEGLGSIAPWLAARGARVTSTPVFDDPVFPAADDFDWLIVMGGPMGANDDALHPWLAPEVALIAEAVAAGKVVLGICLGAQLVARALGARVYANDEPEIGWFPVGAPEGPGGDDGGPLRLPIEALHWHGDTFELPPGAVHLAESAGCRHQAFRVGHRVLALQFHLEMTAAGVHGMMEACRDEIRAAPFIQAEEEILGDEGRFRRINREMERALEWLAEPRG